MDVFNCMDRHYKNSLRWRLRLAKHESVVCEMQICKITPPDVKKCPVDSAVLLNNVIFAFYPLFHHFIAIFNVQAFVLQCLEHKRNRSYILD